MVDLGKRLRELRKAKGLSQGDVEHRSGLLRCYQSSVENGRANPTLRVLERWAKAVDVELYQVFFIGHGRPKAPEVQYETPVGAQERTILELFGQVNIEDRVLLISLARDMVKRKGKRG